MIYIQNTIDDVLQDEDDSRDNMPESLQDTDRYVISEGSSEAMQEAIDNLDEAINAFADDELENARKGVDAAIKSLLQIDGVFV